MKISWWGVILFWLGAFCLSWLVIRRSKHKPVVWTDHVLTFAGLSGVIVGLGLIFLPDF